MHGSTWLEAILLGVVQGITEFLPISSSGHLVIVGELIRRVTGERPDPEANLQLNIALHAGTLLSILWVYRADVLGLRTRPWLCLAIVVATLPAAAVGLTAKDSIEALFATPLVAGACLWITAGLLVAGQRCERGDKDLDGLSQGRALAVGAFQAVALLPGVSRSGSTIAGGLLMGLKREAATAFSFLIAIPAIGGATVLMLRDALETGGTRTAPGVLAAGAATACLVGVLSLRILIRLVVARKLHWFAWYCALAGTATVIWQLLDRPPS
ncbi:MAG TPA: undecaprenyl-diphosphate phosphatase [Planctomycetaceae bacterium]|nr:undecaprenyl-diphosphate phosphatase [Planctomycetaceae bacterium]